MNLQEVKNIATSEELIDRALRRASKVEEKVREIWALANNLGYSEFSYDLQPPIYDDHRAFYIETGIPSLDIIDFLF